MEQHLKASLPSGNASAAGWMQSRLYELEFSGAVGHLRQLLRHPLDAVPGHTIGRTFQHAAQWTSPLPVLQQELQSCRNEALHTLRAHSMRFLAEFGHVPSPAVSHREGYLYEAVLRHDFREAQLHWSRFLESGGHGAPTLPSSSLPDTLPLPPSRLERSIDALGWAMHPPAARHSLRIVVDGVLGVLRGHDRWSPAQAVRLIDALELAGERQLQISQQLRVDACLLQPEGLPRPNGPGPDGPGPDGPGPGAGVHATQVPHLLPFVEKLSPRLKFSATDLQVLSTHPLHRVVEQHIFLANHPPALLEESQSRLEIYQMTRDMHRHLLPLRQALADGVQTGFTHLPPSLMLDVLQVTALREYIQQSRVMRDELNACPPSVRPLMASGFMHARILEQFGGMTIQGGQSRTGLETTGLESPSPSASRSVPTSAHSPDSISPSGNRSGGISSLPPSGLPPPGAGPGFISR